MLHFEPVEVLEVIADEANNKDLGAIVGRYVIADQGGTDETVLLPLDQNILQLPLRGEVVLGTDFGGRHYYMSKLNIRNSPIANSLSGISNYLTGQPTNLGKYFTPSISGSKKLESREGDTIIQGRFGNSIRLGSNQVKDWIDSNTTKEYIDSPNIKITSGINDIGPDINFTYQESLDTDINSIYLTTKENVKFKFNDKDVESFDEPQITLQSDNIVLHGREKFNVYTKEINLGGENTQPVLLGNELKTILDNILTSLSNIVSSYSSANPGAAPGLTADVNSIKQQVNKILSKKVNTE
jgi:hypothetical protein